MSKDQTHPVVLTTAADIAAAIPPLIGYVPTESLVILGFKTLPDDRQVIAVTMCNPLPTAPASSPTIR